MSMLLASAWLALRRIDETGDATVLAIRREIAGAMCDARATVRA